MRKRTSASLLAATAMGGGLLIGLMPVAADAASANLIKNPGAEAAAGGSGGVVKVPSWKTTNGNFTAVKYSTGSGFPGKSSPGPGSRGKNFFAGGPMSAPGSSVATQTVSLKAFAAKIDAGHESFTMSGFFGGFSSQADNSGMEIMFRDAHGLQVGDWTIGFQSAAQRNNVTGLFKQQHSDTVPPTSRSAYIQLICDGVDGAYNDGYIDNVSLTLG